MIDAAILALLNSASAVVALASTRIYKSMLPEGTSLPAVTWHHIGGAGTHTHGGVIKNRDLYVQFSCWGDDPTKMESLAKAVRDAVDGYHGTIGGHTIERAAVSNEIELPGVGNLQFQKALTVLFKYKET